MSDPKIAELKADYPIFELKNKSTNTAKSIFLADGDSVVVPPKGIAKIKAENLNNFPNFSDFEFITPSMSVLASYDVIKRKEKKTPSSNKPIEQPEPQPKPESTVVGNSGSSSQKSGK